MSTANVSDDIRGKFPLHSAVWENDYRRLEEQITIPEVGIDTVYGIDALTTAAGTNTLTLV